MAWLLLSSMYLSSHSWVFHSTPENHGTRYPLCVNCANAVLDPTGHTLTCAWFGRLDVVTGEHSQFACRVVRENDTMCGPDGRFFFHRLDDTVDKNKL